VADQPMAVGRNHAGAFLAAVLQSVKAQIGQLGRFRMTIEGEHPTMIVELVNRE